MKVKVGDTVYDGKDQPIMVILEPKDKENIASMAPRARRYCQFPAGSDPEKIRAWMKEE